MALPELALLFAQYGPGVAGTVIAGIALIIARHILGVLWRALSWIGQAILTEVKWRLGWW